MNLNTIPYKDYEQEVPQEGQHIIGQERGENIIVYQAFNPKIADWAVSHQKFGGSYYKFSRMSWIKPNFLWMMYRAGWAMKEHQQKVLAIEIAKTNFETLLRNAIHSSFKEKVYSSHEAWKEQLASSEVRLQWDPDHDPHGAKLARRAIQIGIRGKLLHQFATDWIVSIEDITPFVHEQKAILDKQGLPELQVIKEKRILIEDQQIIDKLELD